MQPTTMAILVPSSFGAGKGLLCLLSCAKTDQARGALCSFGTAVQKAGGGEIEP
jgi:hypothetical protein